MQWLPGFSFTERVRVDFKVYRCVLAGEDAAPVSSVSSIISPRQQMSSLNRSLRGHSFQRGLRFKVKHRYRSHARTTNQPTLPSGLSG